MVGRALRTFTPLSLSSMFLTPRSQYTLLSSTIVCRQLIYHVSICIFRHPNSTIVATSQPTPTQYIEFANPSPSIYGGVDAWPRHRHPQRSTTVRGPLDSTLGLLIQLHESGIRHVHHCYSHICARTIAPASPAHHLGSCVCSSVAFLAAAA